jgi:hypothetical protein
MTSRRLLRRWPRRESTMDFELAQQVQLHGEHIERGRRPA